MGCLVAIFALAVPRVTLVLIQIFSDRLADAFDSFVIGFLGFLLLPYTTVFYALVWTTGGVQGFGWFLVAIGFLFDLGSYANSGKERRRAGP